MRFLVGIVLLNFVLCGQLRASVQVEALGEQKLAVILIDFVQEGELPDQQLIYDAIFQSQYSINAFYKENSYGRVDFSGLVFGWYQWPDLKGKCSVRAEKVFERVASDLNLKNYDRYLFYSYRNFTECSNVGFGISTHGKIKWQTSVGEIFASVTTVEANYRLSKIVLPRHRLSAITSPVIAHELGHSLGIRGHGNIYDCGSEAVAMTGCEQHGISDRLTLMAGEGFSRPALHFGACHKETMGWIRPEEIIEINVSDLEPDGTHQVSFGPIEYLSELPVTVKINLEKNIPVARGGKVSISKLYLEYRVPFGFDSDLEKLATNPRELFPSLSSSQGSHLSINTKGIQIRGGFFLDDQCVTTYHIDTRPQSLQWEDQEYSLYDHLDGYLGEGETFLEPWNNLEITTLQVIENKQVVVRIKKLRP
jgi:M6 family metalloprotease-like protein